MVKITLHPLTVLDRFERIFTILSLFIYMNAAIPLLITQGASEGDGVRMEDFNFTPLNLLFLLNYFITFTLLILRWDRSIKTALTNPIFVSIVAMAPLSYLWSAMPDETFSGSIGLIGSTLFGFYVATRFSLKEQIKLIGWAFGIALIASFVFIIALPKYGIMAAIHAGSLRGVWTHKNVMGKYMVLSNCIFLMLVQMPRDRRNIYLWLGLISSLILTVGSNSTNALVNSVLVIIIILFLGQSLKLENKKLTAVATFLSLFLWGTIVCFADISAMLLEAVGKDPTLTGRTDIWLAVAKKILERPWLGYGFNGFWNGIRGESADVIRALRWNVPNSHNGYLDFILQIGFIGFAMFIIVYWMTLLKGYLLVRKEFKIEYLWPIVFLIYVFQINLAEPSLLSQNDFFWIIFTIVYFSVALEFKDIFRLPLTVRSDTSLSVKEVEPVNV